MSSSSSAPVVARSRRRAVPALLLLLLLLALLLLALVFLLAPRGNGGVVAGVAAADERSASAGAGAGAAGGEDDKDDDAGDDNNDDNDNDDDNDDDDDDDDDDDGPDIWALRWPDESEQLRQWFEIAPGTPLPAEPERLSGVTHAKYEYNAHRGIPFVVSDAMDGWPARQWTCEFFRRRHPEARIELFGEDSMDVARTFADDYLGEVVDLGMNRSESVAAGVAPTVGSWYWFPINVQHMPLTRDNDALRRALRLPYFVTETANNRMTLENRLELFTGVRASGAPPHSDQVCQYIFSGQTAGRKRWRLAMWPDQAELERLNPGYRYVDERDRDDVADRAATEFALYEFVQRPGDMVFFPPGMIHMTRVADDAAAHGDDACSASFSLQFSDPIAYRYVRHFRDRLVRDRDGVASCFHQFWNVQYFGDGLGPGPNATTRGDVEQWARAKFAELDGDRSGAIERADALRHYAFWESYQRYQMGDYADTPFTPGTLADGFFLFNDRNGDARVSWSEFHDTVLEWSPAMADTTRFFLDRDGFAEALDDDGDDGDGDAEHSAADVVDVDAHGGGV